MAYFQVYQDRAGQYRWRLIAKNGEIVAVSEAYTTLYSAKRSVQYVKALAASAVLA